MKQPSQKVKFDDEAREKISKGVNLLADAVQVTLGPGGRHVAFEPAPGAFAVTKDGVTVAKSIRKLADPFENIGAQMVRQAAQRTAELAGDGTTTATVLARAIFNEGSKSIAAGFNVIDVKKGISEAVDYAVDSLDKMAKPCKTKKELINVATISANSDEALGKIIASAKHKLGPNAAITVEYGRQAETQIEYVEGLRYDEGYASPYFVTNERGMKVEFEDAYIMIVDYKVHTIHEMVDILNEVAATGRPLLILLNQYAPEVVNTLAINKAQGALKVCATPFPMGFNEDGTELAKDLAALTGATVLGHNTGTDVRNCKLEHLGEAKRVIVTRQDTTIVKGGGKKEDIANRVSQIKDFRNKMKTQVHTDKLLPYLDGRIARLTGGIAVIRAGGATELEMREAKDRIDDAVFAVQAASEEGIVPGGGSTLAQMSNVLEEFKARDEFSITERIGISIVQKAFKEPLSQIASNAGYEPTLILEKGKTLFKAKVFNASTGEFEESASTAIIDPVKVVKSAIKNASSIATLLLTTEAVIVTDFNDEEEN
jgi:chaperonin GroEL